MKHNAFVQPADVSTIRSRERVLELLIPKLLGIVWDRGEPESLSGHVRAFVGDNLRIGAFMLVPEAYYIGANLLTPGAGWKKVFSAHIASRSIIDGVWPYWDGRCRILSWKRGAWEDRVVAEQVEPRTLAHLLYAGLTRTYQT